MAFLTEFFARPRPAETERRNLLAFLESVRLCDLPLPGGRPADFPRRIVPAARRGRRMQLL